MNSYSYRAEIAPGVVRDLVNFGDDPRFWDIHSQKGFEPTSVQVLRAISKSGGLFLDIGAHTGVYSLILATSSLRCIAIEPNPLAFARLVSHIRINQLSEWIVPLNLAASDDQCFKTSRWTSAKGFGWIASGTSIRESQVPLQGIFPVLCMKLDDIVRIINNLKISQLFIKIDVEGHEVEVLRGAKSLVNYYKPDILVEILSKEKALEVQNALPEGVTCYKIFEDSRRLLKLGAIGAASASGSDLNFLLTWDSNRIERTLHELKIDLS